MKPFIQLNEIIWEITNNCYQNCSYCGSKDTINSIPINESDITTIIDNIAKYPPKEINISGGNPLLISYETHEYLVSILQRDKTICKLIINPFNLNGIDKLDIISLYDWIGMSINTVEELTSIRKMLYSKTYKYMNKTTIITNFNTENVWAFKDIEEFVKGFNLTWQIQYTMYKNKDECKSIYRNEEAKKYLFDKINNSTANIVMADNMNPNNSCGAGISGIGILANGDVVPCLSMRSWEKDYPVMGNLLEDSLSFIWETEFSYWRCNEFKCCKDHTECFNDKQYLNETKEKQDIVLNETIPFINIPNIKPYKPVPSVPSVPPFTPQIIMYGVSIDPVFYEPNITTDVSNITFVYGVTKTNKGE